MNAEQMKQQYLSFINEHSLLPKQFIVGAGGSMLLRGYRLSSEDIDVAVDEDTFNHLLARVESGDLPDAKLLLGDAPYVFAGRTSTEPTGHHSSGKPVIAVGDFEIHLDPRAFEDGEYEVIDGIGLQTISSVYAMKKALGRLKDKNDLILLEIVLIHPEYEVPRISAGLKVLHNELGEEYFNYPPRIIGTMLAQREWITLQDITKLTESKTILISEYSNVANLLVGNAIDEEEAIVSIRHEIIEEFALGIRFAQDAIYY